MLARARSLDPLMRDGLAIGVIGMNGDRTGGFSESQIELLKTFAEQAVIAITSAETYRALQTRTSRSSGVAGIPDRDQRRAEGHQPLDVRSATRARTVVETAARLCDADRL